MFQLIPVFMLFLSPIFLSGQDITPVQLLGGGIITLAAILITYEPTKKKFDKNKLITLTLMSVVSILYALWFILERYVNQNHDFNQTTFWSNLTLFFVGIIIFVSISSYRNSFQKMLKTNGTKVIGLNLINELLNSFGSVLSTFAGTTASVALVSFTTQGVQPFAVMIMGILLTKFLPKTEKENITRKIIIRRTATIILCLIGLACIEFG
jgi:drug/metabolite transporter (DMT)-like permease